MAKKYEGKAKIVEEQEGKDGLVKVIFKDSTTAGNGEKKADFANKGACCAEISSILFEYLKDQGVTSHYVGREGTEAFIARKVDIVPLEVVIRNIAAGSICRRTGLTKGTVFNGPIVEYYYKDDDLGDPLLNRDHIDALGVADNEDLAVMRDCALRANEELSKLFADVGLKLVDIKFEFGRDGCELLLADEISPDTCRLWDGDRSLDKDVFRRGDGSPVSGYEEVLNRLRKVTEKGA